MKRLLLIAALSMGLCSCYQPPGSGPAPPSGDDLTSAAVAVWPVLRMKYADVDRKTIEDVDGLKDISELYDLLEERSNEARKEAFADVVKAFDARFEKDEKTGKLLWDKDRAKKALADEAAGFSR